MSSVGKVCDPNDNTVLILSHYWTPIGITSARDGVRKLCREQGQHRGKNTIFALDRHYNMNNWDQWVTCKHREYFDDQPHLRSFTEIFPVPTILLTTARWSYKCTQKPNVKYMYKRYKGVCQICGDKKPIGDMSVEHILPKSLHGTNDSFNITLTCKSCNNKRGNVFPFLSYTGKPLSPLKPMPFLHVFGCNRKEWEPFLVPRLE